MNWGREMRQESPGDLTTISRLSKYQKKKESTMNQRQSFWYFRLNEEQDYVTVASDASKLLKVYIAKAQITVDHWAGLCRTWCHWKLAGTRRTHKSHQHKYVTSQSHREHLKIIWKVLCIFALHSLTLCFRKPKFTHHPSIAKSAKSTL